ncbi:SMI1/KNR4 family protein [Flavobacterium sp. AC]|uniref:SMI1/KNR4 family protein n=1 Tax=Flavobacterium azizsancarii TaxID=2961580 RepID=A0ABT4WBF5_9FLAO|nr:SMI1/KNR4 family protein [Flavobacterium azizsancarii]MDA6069845.1 SMI1/KNR4 family protein [Flavobacterium azizsancarii]
MDKLHQIERIKKKLIIAKNADKDLKVFGAGSHQYILGEPVSKDQISEFEKEYNLILPECYKAFLLHISNGGVTFENSSAGPAYGIYPLGKNTNEFIDENAELYLKKDCNIHPKMSDEFWSDLNKNIDDNDDISDEGFDLELGKIFSGLLPIGTQGCNYYYALVLNGRYKGSIVNVDIGRQKPYFAFESDFLDWYERWLDGIIPENVMLIEPDLFRYTLGGTSNHILEVYFSSNENDTKIECLNGILKKQQLDLGILDILEQQYKVAVGKIQKLLLQILTKFDYERAKPHLVDFTKESLLDVFQFVFWYAKDKSSDWLDTIKSNTENINDDEIFSFCTYLLKEMNFDYGDIIVPFTLNNNEGIRVSAYYSLGQLENKSNHIDTFILGLRDNSNRVIHTVLQALDGVEDQKLLEHYKFIAEKFPKEQDYILVNLNHRLKSFGLNNKTVKGMKI